MHSVPFPRKTIPLMLIALLATATLSPAADPEHPTEELLAQAKELQALRGKPLHKEHFEKLLPILDANANAWLEYEPSPYPMIDNLLDQVRYDDQSYDDLTEVLKTLRRTDTHLFILNSLLLPTTGTQSTSMATEEQAKKIADFVAQIVRRHSYRKIPVVSAAQASRLKLPEPEEVEKSDSEEIMRKMAAAEKLREIKLKRERPLARNNEGLWDLEKKTLRLQIIAAAQDERTTRKLIKDIEKMAGEHNAMAKHACSIAGDIGSKDRFAKDVGERWYDLMKQIANSNEEFWKQKWLSFEIDIRLDRESVYETTQCNPESFAGDANRFAEKVGQPKLVLKK